MKQKSKIQHLFQYLLDIWGVNFQCKNILLNNKNSKKHIPVSDITLYQSRPFRILIGNLSSATFYEQVYSGGPNRDNNLYWIQLSPPRLLQYVRIEHHMETTMVVCEVLIYDTGSIISTAFYFLILVTCANIHNVYNLVVSN